MKIEITSSEVAAENGRPAGRALPRQVVLSAEGDSDAEALSRFLDLIDAAGWEWLLGALARRCEQKALRP